MQQNVTLKEVKAFQSVANTLLGLLFHRRAQRIGQKTELYLLKVFADLLQLHFDKCCFLPLRLCSLFSCEIAGLEQELNP